MRRSLRLGLALLLGLALPVGLAAAPAPSQAAALEIAAAENFYGDLAAQLGGGHVAVTSILRNPDQDPHLFEASPATARALSAAEIVIYNGADYDPWMAKLLAAAGRGGREVIIAADVAGSRRGDDPHLWYRPDVMPKLAKRLAEALAARDPANAPEYRRRLQAFEASLAPLSAKIRTMRQRHEGDAIAATEPVFGYMAEALGLKVGHKRFQLAIMNDTEPSASDVAALERDLKGRRVRALVYNSQAASPVAERLKRIAAASGVPVVGVSETEPAGTSYQRWMLEQLAALEKALGGPGS
jgi:zinc/manganese transport system substrate-binding protein